MSKRQPLPVRPTAAQVRSALGLEPKRGNLSQEVIDAYNKGKRAEKRYVRGNTRTATAERKAQRASLVEQGLAGKRGPLPKAVQESLSQKG